MKNFTDASITPWPWWRNILFRFSCLYLLLYMSPWTWLAEVPWFSILAEQYSEIERLLVTFGNDHLFHVKEVLVPANGSGDTSYSYAQLCFYTLVAVVGTLVWTLLARKKMNYVTGYYWLLVVVRYYVALTALAYGIIKLFGLQMPFPTLSALATPLGDLLPMRFSWHFIGYSTPYQFFSGAMEALAGSLLLARRTCLLGALVAVGVFLNVMMMNLCYDIPVKLFSIHLFAFSVFLLLSNAERLLNFFLLNRPVEPTVSVTLPDWRWRFAQLTLKTIFIGLFLLLPFYQAYSSRSGAAADKLATGFFAVEQFQAAMADSLHWKDVIFEQNNSGSILTADTLLRQRYRRAYFSYALDSTNNTIAFRRFSSDTVAIFTLNYTMPDTNHILLRGLIRQDSVAIALTREPRHYQLAERQFHWLSEQNR
ncbi:hypothetical protein [Hymenobacter sp.]|jgi:hypothetical protein|uniref:hypothetical protein n=1 Tax=Hymenobacter sp. TaxID=1898978 RepID=UPI002EDAE57D